MNNKKDNKYVLNKAFFGKINCLKILMNSQKEVYFHLGILSQNDNNWAWKKVKMNDSELGEIINLLSKNDGKCSFFHSYDSNKTQIWCNKSEKSFNIKINEFSKNLTVGEFEVLKSLIDMCIKKMNFN